MFRKELRECGHVKLDFLNDFEKRPKKVQTRFEEGGLFAIRSGALAVQSDGFFQTVRGALFDLFFDVFTDIARQDGRHIFHRNAVCHFFSSAGTDLKYGFLRKQACFRYFGNALLRCAFDKTFAEFAFEFVGNAVGRPV